MVLGDGVPIITFEGQVAGRGAVQGDPECVEIAPTVDLLPAGLFRAEIMGGAHHLIGGAQRRCAGEGARQAEIGDDGLAVGAEQDVVGLDVAMDDAAGMGDGQGCGHIGADPDAFCLWESAGQRKPASEGEGMQIHGDEHRAVYLPDIANGDDIAMPETGRGGRFSTETGFREVVSGKFRAQDFQGDRDLQILVNRLVHP